MILIISIAAILSIAFLWALWSLYRDLSRPKALKSIRDELAREKILYKR